MSINPKAARWILAITSAVFIVFGGIGLGALAIVHAIQESHYTSLGSSDYSAQDKALDALESTDTAENAFSAILAGGFLGGIAFLAVNAMPLGEGQSARRYPLDRADEGPRAPEGQ